ncbi:MAG TPA: thiamine ABC transporter substrate binding subunit [Thermohalobaculum sp.]|nr:thiamine ABC transporter substrate binding subunit [Thermohalobaculum sp.]
MSIRTLIAAVALGAALTAPAPATAADEPVLTIYTYDSFASEWGPGPVIEEGFEAVCACDVKFVGLDTSIGAFSRIRLEGEGTAADVLLGLDVNLAGDARASGVFVEHGADLAGLDLPIAWDDPVLAPFDWGHFAFVHDTERLAEPPGSLEALAASDLEIVIQDPRSSTPGLGLVMWVRAVYGDAAPDYWRRLKPRILTVTKGWSDSYALFLEGEADMALSYTTSPAYHMVAEDRHNIRAAAFEEGHYLQMELAAVTAASDQPELARRFIEYLIGPEAQAAIPTTNWMFPVNGQVELPDAFATLVRPERTLAFAADEAAANRKAWIQEWLEVMGE